MKNILCVKELSKCDSCHMKGFFCFTPVGADFHTCPCCGKYDFLNDTTCFTRIPTKYDFLGDPQYDEDMRNTFRYCDNCKILFNLGCMHYAGGCTDNVYNCHFIQKWKNKSTNETHEGMPQFEDTEDWFNNVNNVDVLQMYCPHKSNICKSTRYTINNETCDLMLIT